MDFERLLYLTSQTGCTKTNRPYMVAYDSASGRAFVFRPDCKCWNCQPCANRQRDRWGARTFVGLEYYMAAGLDFRFVTLTSHERLITLSQTLQVWPKAWNKLQNKVRRAFSPWIYILVPERHRDGRLHVHMISSANYGSRWWKDNARASGLGYMAEEAEFKDKEANPARASAYCLKYLDKSMGVLQWPRSFRRIRTSQQFPELPTPDGNPYDALEWTALKPAELLNWAGLQNATHTPVYYTGTGEEIS